MKIPRNPMSKPVPRFAAHPLCMEVKRFIIIPEQFKFEAHSTSHCWPFRSQSQSTWLNCLGRANQSRDQQGKRWSASSCLGPLSIGWRAILCSVFNFNHFCGCNDCPTVAKLCLRQLREMSQLEPLDFARECAFVLVRRLMDNVT
jgi:hypothetical protein